MCLTSNDCCAVASHDCTIEGVCSCSRNDMLERIWMISTHCSRDSTESEMSMISDDHESMHSLWMNLWINGEYGLGAETCRAEVMVCVCARLDDENGIPSLVARGSRQRAMLAMLLEHSNQLSVCH